MRSAAVPDSAREPDGSPNDDLPRVHPGVASIEVPTLEVVRQSVTTAANLAHERTLPVVDALASLVPTGGVQRGSSLAVHGVGATSFALALAGQAVRDGSFMAVVAPSSFGLAACLDFAIPLRRVVQFVLPDDASNWAQAVAAIIEGFDVVLLADRHRVSHSQARQLTARTRERGSVMVRVGGPAWSSEADLRFDVTAPDWSGLGQGHGHLRSRQVAVQVAGRRYHGRQGPQRVMLPAISGGVAPVEQPIVEQTPVEQVPVEPIALRVAVDAGSGSGVSAATERFAGADIDAFLEAADRLDAEDGASGLDAIA